MKSKQDAVITKELIQRRHLDQSVLRFTRLYRDEHNQYVRDLKSTAYSCVMTEGETAKFSFHALVHSCCRCPLAQPDVNVEKVGPSYGPMTGDTVYVVIKGRVAKDELAIEVIENETGQRQQVPYTKNGNSVYFTMPNVAHSLRPHLMVTILITYKDEELHQSAYRYESSLDSMYLFFWRISFSNPRFFSGIFQELNIGDTHSNAAYLPTSSRFNNADYSRATGARLTALSSRRTSTTKTPKRLTPVKRRK